MEFHSSKVGNHVIKKKLSKIVINFNVISLNICGILSICDQIHYWSKVAIIRILMFMNDF